MKLTWVTFAMAAVSAVSAFPSFDQDNDVALSAGLEARREKWPVGRAKDDYPYKEKCNGTEPDRYGFPRCRDTSFVAWRLNERINVKFNRTYKGIDWGDASTWLDVSRRANLPIDGEPWGGVIGYTNVSADGTDGHHVVWVCKRFFDDVVIEEYDYKTKQGWARRQLPWTALKFIHFIPPPE